MLPQRAPDTAILSACPECGRSAMIYALRPGGPRRCVRCHAAHGGAAETDAPIQVRAADEHGDRGLGR